MFKNKNKKLTHNYAHFFSSKMASKRANKDSHAEDSGDDEPAASKGGRGRTTKKAKTEKRKVFSLAHDDVLYLFLPTNTCFDNFLDQSKEEKAKTQEPKV